MRSPDAHSRQDGDTVEVRELQRTPTAVRRGRVAVAELPRWLGDAYRDVMTYLGTVGAAPAGPPFACYERVDAGFQVEAGFPVTASVPGNGRVHPSSLPGGRAVVVWHRGPDDGLAAAYADAEAEVERLGGLPSELPWETYHTGPDTDPSEHVTEVVQPYRLGSPGRAHVTGAAGPA